METYLEMQARHKKQVNNFPMMFAFNNKQFEESMEKLGLESSDTDKIYSLGAGGFIKKSDSDAFNEMFKRIRAEMKEGHKDYNFAFGMFDYELSNHEYKYTYDVTDTLDALDISQKDIEASDTLKRALQAAIALQRASEEA